MGKKKAEPDLKSFRSGIAKLKKAGLLAKNIDARKVKPTPYYQKVLRKYEDVAAGRRKTIKVSTTKARAAKDLGYKVGRGNRVVVDNLKGKPVVKDKNSPTGFRVKETPRPRLDSNWKEIKLDIPKGETINSYLNKVERELAKMDIPRGSKLAFEFFGNPSRKFYSSIEQIRETLAHYQSVREAINNRNKQREQVKNLVIVRGRPNTK